MQPLPHIHSMQHADHGPTDPLSSSFFKSSLFL
jgi:hypothetical protein